MTTVSDSTAVGDVVAGSATGVRAMLWRLRPSEVRDVAVSASAEILRLEAIRVAAVDELALNPDEQVLCYRGVGRWLAANTMLQNAAGNKIAALGAALRGLPDIAAQFEAGDLSLDHVAIIAAFCESPPKGMPDRALPSCMKTLLAAASGVEATTIKLRYAIAVLERIFESDQAPPGKAMTSMSCGLLRRSTVGWRSRVISMHSLVKCCCRLCRVCRCRNRLPTGPRISGRLPNAPPTPSRN